VKSSAFYAEAVPRLQRHGDNELTGVMNGCAGKLSGGPKSAVAMGKTMDSIV